MITTKNGNVVHKHIVDAYPNVTTIPLNKGDSIVSVMWDEKVNNVVAYSQKASFSIDNDHDKVEIFIIGTGQQFFAEGFDFLGTVSPDNRFFFHAYQRRIVG